MRKPASLLIFLMVTLTLQPAIANGLTQITLTNQTVR